MNKTARIPGGNAIDDVIASSQTGTALKVDKPHAEQAPAQIVGAHDPNRNAEAPINRQPEMTYAEAMEAQAAGTLTHPVLTEQGWVTLRRSSMKEGSAAA
jgi:hypothetical protein